MTPEEAIAFVLREGYPGEAMPDDALSILLSMRYDLSNDLAHAQMRSLIEALHIVHEEIRGQASVDKRLAGALYSIGAGASVAKINTVSARENDDIVDLVLAVEAAFFDIDLGDEREPK